MNKTIFHNSEFIMKMIFDAIHYYQDSILYMLSSDYKYGWLTR